MTTEEALWPAVEGKLGGRLSSSEREYGRQRGRVLLFLDADDDVGRADSVADMAEDIHCLRATGFSTPDEDELSYESPTDGRWGLLRDLHAAAHGEDEPWAPVSVTRSRPIGFYVGGRPRPTAEWVRVTFDRRLSFRALVASLRTLWRSFGGKVPSDRHARSTPAPWSYFASSASRCPTPRGRGAGSGGTRPSGPSGVSTLLARLPPSSTAPSVA